MSNITDINVDSKTLFIDGSYYIFYRYFAIYGWYQLHAEGEHLDVSNITSDSKFMDKYNKMFEKYLVDLQKTHRIDWNNLVFVKDCPREDIFRNQLYKDYKGTRENNLKKFNGDIFKHTYNILLPQLQQKYNFKVLIGKHLEADDVIAILTKEIHKRNQQTYIVIITDDNDYMQLSNLHVNIINLKKKSIAERIPYEPRLYLQYKIIIGDISDNIPPIMKKVGPKTADKLARNEDELVKFFEKHHQAKIQYDLNQKLIDFDFIDKDATNAFLVKVNFTTST